MKKNIKIFIAAASLVTLGLIMIVIFYFINQPPVIKYVFIAATKGQITSEIKEDGTVKPAEAVKLSFEKSAKIKSVNVKVGDQVKAGQVLASLVDTDSEAQLLQANASLQSAQALLSNYQSAYQGQLAKLNDLKNGPTSEDLQVSQTKVDNAQKTIDDAKFNLENVTNKAKIDLDNAYNKTKEVLNDAYAKGFDAINIKIADLFTNSNFDYALTFFTTNDNLKNKVLANRKLINNDLTVIRTEVDNLNSDQAVIDKAMDDVQSRLDNCRSFLQDLNELINYTTVSVDFTQSTQNTYRADISAALTNINTALANIQTQGQSVTAQKATNQNLINAADSQLTQANNALLSAQKDLKLKQAGSSQDQIRAQEEVVEQATASIQSQGAAINQARANVLNYQYQLSKAVLKAPIDGIVTQADVKVGEIAPLSLPVISLMTNAKFQIESYVPESDIGKININQTAQVTFNAYDNSFVQSAKVISIDPAEVLLNNAPNYKVTLEFTKEDSLIKDGLTVSLKIVTAQRKEAIVVPELLVLTKDNKQIVLVDAGHDQVSEREVKTSSNQNGLIEIISGLDEGERIVDFGTNK